MNAQIQAEESRIADKEHREKVEEEAAQSIRDAFINAPIDYEGFVENLIAAIRDGKIAHVKLEY